MKIKVQKPIIKEACESCENCDVMEQALEQSEIFKKNMEDVMKERSKDAEAITNKKPTVIKTNEMGLVENKNITSVKTRKELSELLKQLKEQKIKFNIKRSLKEGFRYDVLTEEKMSVEEYRANTMAALNKFADAYNNLKYWLGYIDYEANEFMNTKEASEAMEDAFAKKSFDELAINQWVWAVGEALSKWEPGKWLEEGKAPEGSVTMFDNEEEYKEFIYPEIVKRYTEYKEAGFDNEKIFAELLDEFGYKDLIKKVMKESLEEATHNKYAKPEGNKIKSFNNALKYAKKDNVPYIYGYTNNIGKFFALEQPIKCNGEAWDCADKFKKQYKNCSVVYVAYPDKSFVKEGLNEALGEKMLYLFPDSPAMGDYENECKEFNLEFLGKNYFEDEENLVIRGTEKDLRKYADWLGYDLHPDYLYKETEFAGNIINEKGEDINIYESKQLTEAPDEFGLPTDDELAAEEEQAKKDLEAKLAAKRQQRDAARQKELDAKAAKEATIAQGKELYDKFIKAIHEEAHDTDSAIDEAFKLLVPRSGKADTVAGEMVRAMMRIMYRDYNDGDKFYEGYGLETCGGSAQYLCNKNEKLENAFNDLVTEAQNYYDFDDKYTEALVDIADILLDILEENPELFGEANTDDSRENYEWEGETVSYDCEESLPDELIECIEKGWISDTDIEQYLEDDIRSYYDTTDDLSVEIRGNQWVYVEGLGSKYACDDLGSGGQLFKWMESYAEDIKADNQSEIYDADDFLEWYEHSKEYGKIDRVNEVFESYYGDDWYEMEDTWEAYNNASEEIQQDISDIINESLNKQEDKKQLQEDLKIICDLSDYTPWSGAESTWEEITKANKEEDLEFLLEDIYPDGLTMTELNDLLWFEADWVLEQLGLKEEEVEEDEFEEEETTKETEMFDEDKELYNVDSWDEFNDKNPDVKRKLSNESLDEDLEIEINKEEVTVKQDDEEVAVVKTPEAEEEKEESEEETEIEEIPDVEEDSDMGIDLEAEAEKLQESKKSVKVNKQDNFENKLNNGIVDFSLIDEE